jgi:hypothetical protein
MKLTKFTPAETWVLLHGKEAQLNDLLKFTLLDLLLKKVLVTEDVQRQPSERDPVMVYKYLRAGQNFAAYKSKAHEDVFLSVFKNNPSSSVLFRNLVKIGYEKSSSTNRYLYRVITSPDVESNFKFHLLAGWFKVVRYSDKGNELKLELQKEMKELESSLPKLVTTDKKRALEILTQIGGNVFLLKGLDFEIAQRINKELLEEMARQKSGTEWSTGCWTAFDTYSTSFDSSCSSDSSSDWGGDSGCSGCSGDSGCSGCGGCGGGD